MADTKPSGVRIIDDPKPPVLQEIAEIDKRGRINILPRWSHQVIWLPYKISQNLELLMVFADPGHIELYEWEKYGPEIMERYNGAKEEQTEENLEQLRLIQDRYNRLSVTEKHRPYLGQPALVNLGVPFRRLDPIPVYVTLFPEKISIMSSDYRNSLLVTSSEFLENLP